MNKELAKQQIEILINKFAEKEKFYKDKSHSKESIKVEFITPFFRALGWDIENKQSREVIFEDRTRIEGRIKRPDYGFYLNDKRQFFLEAKAAHEDLKNNWEHAYQLKSYGWSSKLKISILTDFEELAIYDCRYYPEKLAETSKHRIKYLNYKNYLKEFDFLWDNLSREAVLNGSLNRLVKDVKNIEKEAVDKKFLDFLEEERIRLAGEIAKLNPTIGQFELNKALVKLINRIVFLRIAEDRDIEKYGELQELVARSKKEKALESLSEIKEKPKVQNLELIYPELKILFAKANEKYNSEMFELDKTDLELHIKDQVLYHFIENLYYPNSPYIFDAISIDVLGSTYERFLGSVVVLSSLHEAIVEQKPEVRKAGGVYYTPEYIVDYIVENTVGELIKSQTPEEVSKIKILDPACGSGSFLIGVYEYLLDWHLKYYEKASLKEQKDNIDFVEGKPRLTIKLKKQILLNNIFGVDIDEQAINVTKLSLCLKCLEGETEHSLRNQLALFKTQALPTLKDNVKCGNSLISSDFAKYELGFNKWNEDEQRKINPFNWEREFPQVFNKSLNQDSPDLKISKINKETKSGKSSNQENQGSDGFDIVIGNPPYVIVFDNQIKSYLENKYLEFKRNNDLYVAFISQCLSLVKNAGSFSMITPNSFIRGDYFKVLRETLNKYQINEIVDFGNRLIFNTANVFTSIFNITKNRPNENWTMKSDLFVIQSMIKSNSEIYISKNPLIEKLDKYKQFEDFFLVKDIGYNYWSIGRGKQRGDSIGSRILYKGEKQNKLDIPYLKGTNFNRYTINEPSQFLRHDYEKYLNENDIFRFSIEVLETCPKLIYRQTSSSLIGTIEENKYHNDKTVHIIIPQNKYCINLKYVLALFNSKLLNYYYQEAVSENGRAFAQVKVVNVKQLPYIESNRETQETIIKLVDEILALNEQKKTASEYQIQRILQPQIDEIDKDIDKLVYDLYGLTEEEIKIVEGMG